MKGIEKLLKLAVLRTLPGATIKSCNFEGRVCDMVADAPWEKRPKKMSFLLSERSEAAWKNNSLLGFTYEEVLSAQAIKEGLSDEKYEADEVYYVIYDPWASKGIFIKIAPEMDGLFLFDRFNHSIFVASSAGVIEIDDEDSGKIYCVDQHKCISHARRI